MLKMIKIWTTWATWKRRRVLPGTTTGRGTRWRRTEGGDCEQREMLVAAINGGRVSSLQPLRLKMAGESARIREHGTDSYLDWYAHCVECEQFETEYQDKMRHYYRAENTAIAEEALSRLKVQFTSEQTDMFTRHGNRRRRNPKQPASPCGSNT